jgi:hypothetical protein
MLTSPHPTPTHTPTPKPSNVRWSKSYNPRRHQLVEAGRYLKRLELTETSLVLLGHFDAVDELHLDILLSRIGMPSLAYVYELIITI